MNAEEALQQGLRYSLGQGVPKSDVKARAFFVQAAEAENPNALFFAGNMLAHGEGGPFDRATAFRYIQRAADLGNLDAIYTLGYYYMTGGMGNLGYPKEVLQQIRIQQDENRGLTLWRAAADRGHGEAAYRMGEYYEERANEIAQAIDWYEKSIELGEPNGLIRLGDFHILGKGITKDLAIARSLYQRAADSDDVCAKSTGTQRLEEFDELETLLKEDR